MYRLWITFFIQRFPINLLTTNKLLRYNRYTVQSYTLPQLSVVFHRSTERIKIDKNRLNTGG